MNRRDDLCMLAEDWDGRADLSGWLVSEKLDGVRARWTGERFVTRYGNPINPPDWFLAGLPKGVELDVEFWIKRNYFNETSGIIRRARPRIGGAEWKAMRCHVFDAPALALPAAGRLAAIPNLIAGAPYAVAVQHVIPPDNQILLSLLLTVLEKGGEGLMAIHPRAGYAVGKRFHFLKVKVWQEAEAVMLKRNTVHQSIRCKLPTGVEFDVGLPSYEWQRNPPNPGDWVTFRYWNFDAKSGVPRHPTLKGVRDYE
jgi:DNA ligase-1